ncbi:MAG: Probable GTPase related to EngC [uncultured Frankineae bacterium]|uniref:Small ribosomal subunit biogenesis GTPase RsgA n=1 Tax=uncultured Frankineae bacterium TaxID=437475 RepID=A0A6J4KMV7_9ACTN|nr:MAG: Probable GTPase related to EngC [uncultured Frankineae bacterium]
MHLPLPGHPPDTDLPDGTVLARVVRVDRGAYDVVAADGPRRLPSLPPPEQATVGDWLAVTDDAVAAVLPRSSLLVRGASSGHSRSQPLAANVDAVLICASLAADVPVRRIERLLTLAWESGATPVVVLTKADLHPDPAAAVEALVPHAPGCEVVTVSASTGDVAALRPYAGPGSTLVLLGASGAGKSTVVNALAGAPVMATGDVREADGKGRHTTSHRELVVLPSGAVVIDTPGLRGVALAGTEDGLARAFADVEDLAAACRFADCHHTGEPGCAVQASIDAGDLSADRMESWRRLQRELAWQARRNDARLQAEERARWRTVQRARRGQVWRP